MIARIRRWLEDRRDRRQREAEERQLRGLGPHYRQLEPGTCGWCQAIVPVKRGGLGDMPCIRCGRQLEMFKEPWQLAAEWADGCTVLVYSVAGMATVSRPKMCRTRHRCRQAAHTWWKNPTDELITEVDAVALKATADKAMEPPPLPIDPDNAWAPYEYEQPYDPSDERTISPL